MENLPIISGGMRQGGTRLRDQGMGEVAPFQDEIAAGPFEPFNLRWLLFGRKVFEARFLLPGCRLLHKESLVKGAGGVLDMVTRCLLRPVAPPGSGISSLRQAFTRPKSEMPCFFATVRMAAEHTSS